MWCRRQPHSISRVIESGIAGLTLRLVDDDLLVIKTSWPGMTIDGDLGVISGLLSVSRAAGGEFLLDLSVGPSEAHLRTAHTRSSRCRTNTLKHSARHSPKETM